MNRQILTISSILFLFYVKSAAQINKSDKIFLSKQIQKFIPKGYAILDKSIGDLNLDKFKDIILVLKDTAEKDEIDTIEFKRPLLILIGHADKSFTLAGRNDDVVYCVGCGGIFGDPYDGITIYKGTFTINHFGGSNDRWSNEITFKYSATNKTWYLFKVVEKGWNVGNLNKIDSTIKTKKDFGVISFEKYNPDSSE
jgi:hypothetical protein